jgi:DNA processing protein
MAVDDRTTREHAALVALLRQRPGGMTWTRATEDVLYHGSALQVWKDYQADALLAEDGPLEDALAEVLAWRGQGLRFVSVLDPDYPRRLRGVHEAPPFLFAAGALDPEDRGVSVVGSRKASARGLQIAGAVAQLLVSMDLSVISGLAAGIDAAAHTAALEAGGRPVGVIGTGITRTYPAVNAELHRRVAERGVLLSQFWPDASPTKRSFPMRNATMSGYGLATVVVEAGEHSGARIQARVAVAHGRPVLLTELVVNATDWGKALQGQPGVYVVQSVEDVREALGNVLGELERADQVRRLVSATV